MKKDYLLNSKTALKLFAEVEKLPIIDYHCHLSPKEIFEDKPFDSIGEIWLDHDHYKWRLMRTAGIDEKYITGDSSHHDKFINYAKALEFAAGNPLYHWSHMELSEYFGIDDMLNEQNAEDIWQRANEYIKQSNMSPRKLIEQSNVEVICTTDDVADSLEWHEKIKNDPSFSVRVLPSFRTDNLLLMQKDGYGEYLKRLEKSAGIKITDFASFKKAVSSRLDYFVKAGCRYTDVGIPTFPDRVYEEKDAAEAFAKVLGGEKPSDGEYMGLLGNMYKFLGELYKEYDLVMQWHINVRRNANSIYFNRLGADCGVDCVNDAAPLESLIKMLDAINCESGLPQTVLYTLNSSSAAGIASVAGAFPNVRCGAAWWFCDHKRGIDEQIRIIAENGSLGSFLGMLTDSRSFLSYARHGYFRRILCDIIGDWVGKGEYDGNYAAKLCKKICYENIKELTGDEK